MSGFDFGRSAWLLRYFAEETERAFRCAQSSVVPGSTLVFYCLILFFFLAFDAVQWEYYKDPDVTQRMIYVCFVGCCIIAAVLHGVAYAKQRWNRSRDDEDDEDVDLDDDANDLHVNTQANREAAKERRKEGRAYPLLLMTDIALSIICLGVLVTAQIQSRIFTKDACAQRASLYKNMPSRVYDSAACERRLDGHPTMILVLLAFRRLRFFLMATMTLVMAAFAAVTALWLPLESPSLNWLQVVHLTALAAFACFVRFLMEVRERNRFERDCELNERFNTILEHSRQLENLVGKIVPAVLLERSCIGKLTSGSTDVQTNGVVLVANVFDFSSMCNILTPLELAASLDRCAANVTALCAGKNLHRVAVVQDEVTVVGNLLGVPKAGSDELTAHFTIEASRVATQAMEKEVRGPLPLRAAVHVGSVEGEFVGTSWTRYEVRGEGLVTCRSIVKRAGELEVYASEDALEAAEGAVVGHAIGEANVTEDIALSSLSSMSSMASSAATSSTSVWAGAHVQLFKIDCIDESLRTAMPRPRGVNVNAGASGAPQDESFDYFNAWSDKDETVYGNDCLSPGSNPLKKAAESPRMGRPKRSNNHLRGSVTVTASSQTSEASTVVTQNTNTNMRLIDWVGRALSIAGEHRDEELASFVEGDHFSSTHFWIFFKRFDDPDAEAEYLQSRRPATLQHANRVWFAYSGLLLILFVVLITDLYEPHGIVGVIGLLLAIILSLVVATLPLSFPGTGQGNVGRWLWTLLGQVTPLVALFACAASRPSAVGNDARPLLFVAPLVQAPFFLRPHHQLIGIPAVFLISQLHLMLPGGELDISICFVIVVVTVLIWFDAENDADQRRDFIVSKAMEVSIDVLHNQNEVRNGLLHATLPSPVFNAWRARERAAAMSGLPVVEQSREARLVADSLVILVGVAPKAPSALPIAAGEQIAELEAALQRFTRSETHRIAGGDRVLCVVALFGDHALLVSPVEVDSMATTEDPLPVETLSETSRLAHGIEAVCDIASLHGSQSLSSPNGASSSMFRVFMDVDSTIQVFTVDGLPTFSAMGVAVNRLLAIDSSAAGYSMQGVYATQRVVSAAKASGLLQRNNLESESMRSMRIRGVGVIRLERLFSTSTASKTDFTPSDSRTDMPTEGIAWSPIVSSL